MKKFKDSSKLEELYEKITNELEKGKKRHPYDPQVYFILGRLYWMEEEILGKENGYQKAEEVLKEGLKLSPKRPIYLMELTQVYIYEENYPEAEKILNFYANEVAPFSWRPYEVLGHFYYITKDYQKAEKAYLKAINLGWNFWREKLRFERLVLTLKETQNWSEIVSVYEKYLKYHPDEAQAWYNFAVALKKIGNHLYKNWDKFEERIKEILKDFNLSPNFIKNIILALSEHDDSADYVLDKKGNRLPDPNLRDSEKIPLKQDIEEYFEREVRPYYPDAWMDRTKDRIGYEINFTKYFYKYIPPRPLEDIEKDIKKVTEEIQVLLKEGL